MVKPHNDPYSPNYASRYRLTVKARASSGPQSFIWEIVRGGGIDESSVKQSSKSFKSMEEAYTHGSVALGLLRKPA
jgi:hypothetical protein